MMMMMMTMACVCVCVCGIAAIRAGRMLGLRKGKSVMPFPLARLLKFDLTCQCLEVRTDQEWKLFSKIADAHRRFGCNNTQWEHRYYREVDMTMDKRHFTRTPNIPAARSNLLPVIEGRMVHQFQFGAKRYISGSGRSAVWESSQAASVSEVRPQFRH